MRERAVAARRARARAVVLIASIALCAGCGRTKAPLHDFQRDPGPPRRGGTLRMVSSSDIDHLLTTSGYVTSSLLLFQTFARELVAYPPLADYDARTTVAADLATELPTLANGGISADGRVYRLELRRGVQWNSAPPRPVTAHDVVRAFKLFCNPVSPVGSPSYYTTTIAGMAEYCERFTKVPGTIAAIREFVATHELEGVRAIDERRIEFRLLAPAADFLNLLAMSFAAPVPAEYLDYLPDSPEFRRHTLSDGPYQITRYVQSREIELERNPVWDPATDPIRAAYVDRISIRFGIDDELTQLQLEAGTADLGFDVVMLTANQASLRSIGDPRVRVIPDGDHYAGMHYLAVNIPGPNNAGALRMLEVRQALALAVDRHALMQLTGGPGMSRPLNQAVASTVAGFRPGADRFVTPDDRGDPAAARRLLARAGYPDGLRLRLAYQANGIYPIEVQSLQASLGRAGFDVELKPYSGADFWGRLMPDLESARRGEWDLGLVGWVADWFGRSNGRSVIVPLFDGRRVGRLSTNFGGYQNARVDAAIDRARTAASLDAAEAAWGEAADLVMADAGIIPLIERKSGLMLGSRLRHCSWSILGNQCDLNEVWLADAPLAPLAPPLAASVPPP